MCKCKMIEITVVWEKEGQEKIKDLGIPGLEAEVESGSRFIDLWDVVGWHPYKKNNKGGKPNAKNTF